MYANAIRTLAKGYLPISLISPKKKKKKKIQEILNAVQTTLCKTNPDYDLVVKRLIKYHDMKLVTFSIYSDKNLIIQFPVLYLTLCAAATGAVSDSNSTVPIVV